MKRLLPGLISLALFFTLAACGDRGEETAFDPAADAKTLLASEAFSEARTEIDQETACILYGIDASEVTGAAAYGSTGTTAEELALFTFGTEEAAAEALKSLQYRIEDRKEALTDYQPQEIVKLDSAVAVQRGTSVLLVVANDYAPVTDFLK